MALLSFGNGKTAEKNRGHIRIMGKLLDLCGWKIGERNGCGSQCVISYNRSAGTEDHETGCHKTTDVLHRLLTKVAVERSGAADKASPIMAGQRLNLICHLLERMSLRCAAMARFKAGVTLGGFESTFMMRS